jgi:hypothetical protein
MLSPEWRAEGPRAGHRRHERGRAPRHRADVVLLRSGDRRRPEHHPGAPFDDSGKDSAILEDFRGKVDKLKTDDATKNG